MSESNEPTREDVDRMPGGVMLEFGSASCPHCQAIQDDLKSLKNEYPTVRHIPVEDGPGRPLGRSFRVKLWPTLVFLRDGKPVSQLVRPTGTELTEGYAELSSAVAAGRAAGA